MKEIRKKSHTSSMKKAILSVLKESNHGLYTLSNTQYYRYEILCERACIARGRFVSDCGRIGKIH